MTCFYEKPPEDCIDIPYPVAPVLEHEFWCGEGANAGEWVNTVPEPLDDTTEPNWDSEDELVEATFKGVSLSWAAFA